MISQGLAPWDVATSREIRASTGQLSPILAVVCSRDDQTLASVGHGESSESWRLKLRRPMGVV